MRGVKLFALSIVVYPPSGSSILNMLTEVYWKLDERYANTNPESTM